MASVSIRDLGVSIEGNAVLSNLSLDVEEGEFLVLLGPSGCGKSTLLQAIAGLLEVRAGEIRIGGTDMTWVDPSERNIGMVFQSYALYPTMTVEGNLSFGLRVKGLPRAEVARRVSHAVSMLQLEPLLKRKPAQLSGGQRQRVAIGRALVREAGVFLFDEPLSNLDAKLRSELRREIKTLHAKLRSTMIYVTHDQVEAMTLASRIAVMRGGVIQQIGTPSQVYDRPDNLFVAGFLGAPGMNLLKGTLRRNGERAEFVCGATRLDVSRYPFSLKALDGDACVLGIRPENIRLVQDGGQRGSVSLVEAMGNHAVVWVELGTDLVAAMVSGGTDLSPGSPIGLDIDVGRISLFDAATGNRL